MLSIEGMLAKPKRHILVTGSPRSGTTFLGSVLAFPNEVGYVREPFNQDFGLEGLEQQFMYLYPGMPREEHYRSIVEKLLTGRAKFRRMPASEASDKKQRLGRMVFGSGSNYIYLLAKHNPAVSRFLVKDPMACLASQYMHREFGVQVVVIVRHPLPTIASMRRLRLDHPLSHLLEQEQLYNEHLKPILGGVNLERLSSIERQALLWTCLYYMLNEYIKANDGFIVVKHEDLSRNPETTFRELYDRLGLEYTDSIQDKVQAMTNEKNPIKVKNGLTHQMRRNSKELAGSHYCRFTPGEEKIIHSITDDVTKLFYSSTAWPQPLQPAQVRTADGSLAKPAKSANAAKATN